MKAILHIDNSIATTGAIKALVAFRRNYPARHIIVLPTGSTLVKELRKEFEVYEIPFVELGKKPAKILRYLPMLLRNGKRLNDIIRQESPSLVHINDLYNLLPYYAPEIRKQGIPIIVHLRMLERSFPKRIYAFWKKYHLKRAQGLIAVSHQIHRDWDLNPDVKVMYDPITIDEKLPPFEVKSESPYKFLYLANYIDGKGQQDALEAIALLKRMTNLPFEVHFVGGTMNLQKNEDFKQSLIQRCSELELDSIVRFSGATKEVEKTMKQSHSLLHFSHSESFGMTCYEALYYGLPVISTRCGGPEEMIEPGVSGLLVNVADHKAMAGEMLNLMQDLEYASRLSEQARTRVKAKFAYADLVLNRYFDSLTVHA